MLQHEIIMPSRRNAASSVNGRELPLRLSEADWARIVGKFDLSEQQATVLRHVMGGACDKQIALAMGIRASTVRTYLTRLFNRTGSQDRVELILRSFACIYCPRSGRRSLSVADVARNGNGHFRDGGALRR